MSIVKVVLLVLAAMACLTIVGFGGSRETPPNDVGQRSYQVEFPFDLLAKAALLRPGATYKLIERPFTVSPGMPRSFQIKPSASTRVVRLALVSGPVARVTYCSANDCSRRACLVAKRSIPPPECREDPQEVRGFALDEGSGSIQIEAILDLPVEIESR
ncbi:hypothetical protein JQ582_33020 [Bradyrhizobium japonicum]|uniref:hypothetical protein n=1 Tax=Bradyrhizobium japonicum TaxID=375 RepID=UPI001BAB29E7|nr:hypothetical protein [Bradyrhizobium japonicum]MBR0748764.1 hypothetical protein [Bradyrhizobium japonicum]